MCGHWDLIGVWEVLNMHLPAAASEEKKREWSRQKDKT